MEKDNKIDNKKMAMTPQGMKYLLIGMIVMISGYILMIGGGSKDRLFSIMPCSTSEGWSLRRL